MTVKREETEIRNQAHEMWAEGTSDVEPKKEDIEALLKKEGYTAINIDTGYDGMQGFWRWDCEITPLN
jgi:hypothetical protein